MLVRRRNKYSIGRAPSGRARCRRCKSCPPKGALVIVISAFVRHNRRARLYRCVECITPAFAQTVREAHGRARRVPAEPGMDQEALAEARAQLDRAMDDGDNA